MALADDIGLQAYRARTYWTVSTGGTINFAANGSTEENWREYDSDPWGRQSIIWKCKHNGIGSGSGDGDGGWNGTSFAIDNTKKYRWSIWINRRTIGTRGSTYFGWRAYVDSTMTNGAYLDTTDAGSNMYFWSSGNPNTSFVEGVWYLMIAHVWPYGTNFGSTAYKDSTSGIWNTNGTKRVSITRDFAFQSNNNRSVHRTYLYYSYPYTDQEQWWCYPRVDLCDGNEPTLQQLLRHGMHRVLNTNMGKIRIT